MENQITRGEFEGLTEQVHEIHAALFKGNGKDALMVRVDRLEVAELNRLDREKKRDTRLWAFIIGISVAVLGKVMYDMFVFMPKLIDAVHAGVK